MQRLFSVFPAGLPGLGLLLVRASVALALLTTIHDRCRVLPAGTHAVAIVISIALSVGFLTPIAAAAALVLHGVLWLGTGVDSATAALIFALDSIALALLGPGAYSFDSRRFGRRLVILPPPE